MLASSVSPPFRRVAGGTFKHSLWVLGLRLLEANIRPQGRPRQRLLVLSRSVTTIATAAISCPHCHRVIATVHLHCHASGVARNGSTVAPRLSRASSYWVVIASVIRTVPLCPAVCEKEANISPSLPAGHRNGSLALSRLWCRTSSVLRARQGSRERNTQGRHRHSSLALGRSVTTIAKQQAISCLHSHRVTPTVLTSIEPIGIAHQRYTSALQFPRT